MSKPTLALLIGGLLPSVLFGVSGIFQKTAARAGIGTGPYLIAIGAVVLLAGIAVTLAQGDSTATAKALPGRAATECCGRSGSRASPWLLPNTTHKSANLCRCTT